MKGLSRAQYNLIVKEEVGIAINMVLTGVPFKYSTEARKTYRCPECGEPFQKRIWFQLYDDPKCGNRRRSRIAWRIKQAESRPRGQLRLVK